MAKGPIYIKENLVAHENLLKLLQEAQLNLVDACKATINVTKAGRHVGFGVDKAKRAIAADSVISITKQIKAKPGW